MVFDSEVVASVVYASVVVALVVHASVVVASVVYASVVFASVVFASVVYASASALDLSSWYLRWTGNACSNYTSRVPKRMKFAGRYKKKICTRAIIDVKVLFDCAAGF